MPDLRWLPTALAHHMANATSRRLSDLHVYYHTRNLEFVWIKNMPFETMLRFAHYKVIQELGSLCYLCLRHGKGGPFFRAKRDAQRHVAHHVEKAREDPSRKESPEPLYALSSYLDVHPCFL